MGGIGGNAGRSSKENLGVSSKKQHGMEVATYVEAMQTLSGAHRAVGVGTQRLKFCDLNVNRSLPAMQRSLLQSGTGSKQANLQFYFLLHIGRGRQTGQPARQCDLLQIDGGWLMAVLVSDQ
eukprot:920933-Pelagomonas_calceolata.AAC.3